mgnify:CR=1 FL=1
MHHQMNQDFLKNDNREQILATVAKTFEERVPFNRSLGFEFELPKDGTALTQIEAKEGGATERVRRDRKYSGSTRLLSRHTGCRNASCGLFALFADAVCS